MYHSDHCRILLSCVVSKHSRHVSISLRSYLAQHFGCRMFFLHEFPFYCFVNKQSPSCRYSSKYKIIISYLLLLCIYYSNFKEAIQNIATRDFELTSTHCTFYLNFYSHKRQHSDVYIDMISQSSLVEYSQANPKWHQFLVQVSDEFRI